LLVFMVAPKLQAASKNSFLMIWAADFAPN